MSGSGKKLSKLEQTKDDGIDGRNVLTEAMYMYKLSMERAQQSWGGTVIYVSQHGFLWGAMNTGEFSYNYWQGICAGLSTEWLRAAVQGKDFLNEVIAARHDVFSKASGSRSKLGSLISKVDDSHRHQSAFNQHLESVLRLQGPPVSSIYPFTDFASKLRRGTYVRISSGSHALAGKVDNSYFRNTMTLYVPNVGQVSGIRTEGVGAYLKGCIEGSLSATDRGLEHAAGKTMTIHTYRPL